MAQLVQLKALRYIALPLLFLGFWSVPGTGAAAKSAPLKKTGYSCEQYNSLSANSLADPSGLWDSKPRAQKRERCAVYAQGQGLRGVSYRQDDGAWKKLRVRTTARRNIFQKFVSLQGSRLRKQIFQGRGLELRSSRQGSRICSLYVRGKGFRLYAGGDRSEPSSYRGKRLDVEALDGKGCQLRGQGRAIVKDPLVERSQAPAGSWSGQEKLLELGPYFSGRVQKGGNHRVLLPSVRGSEMTVRFETSRGNLYEKLDLQDSDPYSPPIQSRSWSGWDWKGMPTNPSSYWGTYTWSWNKSDWNGANDKSFYTCWWTPPDGTWRSAQCDYAGKHSRDFNSDGVVQFKNYFYRAANPENTRSKESPTYSFRIDTVPPSNTGAWLDEWNGRAVANPPATGSEFTTIYWRSGSDPGGSGVAYADLQTRTAPWVNDGSGFCDWDNASSWYRGNTVFDGGQPGSYGVRAVSQCWQWRILNVDMAGNASLKGYPVTKIDTSPPAGGSASLWVRTWWDYMNMDPQFSNPSNSGRGVVDLSYPADNQSGIEGSWYTLWRSRGTSLNSSDSEDYKSSNGVSEGVCDNEVDIASTVASSDNKLKYGQSALETGCYQWSTLAKNGVGNYTSSSSTPLLKVDRTDPTGGELSSLVNSTAGSFTVSVAEEYKDFQSGRAHQFLQRKIGRFNENSSSPECQGGIWTRLAWPAGGTTSVSGAQDGSCYSYRYVARNYTFPGTSSEDPSGTESTVDGQSWTEETVFVDSSPPEFWGALRYQSDKSASGEIFLDVDSWAEDWDSGISEQGLERQRKAFVGGQPSGDWQTDGQFSISGEPETVSQNVEGPYCYRYRLYARNGAGLLGYSDWGSSVFRDEICVDTTEPTGGDLTPSPLRNGTWASASVNLQADLYRDPDSGISNTLSERFTSAVENGAGTDYSDWGNLSIISDEKQDISRSTEVQGCYQYRLQGRNGVGVSREIVKEVCRDTSPPAGGSLSVPDRSSSGTLSVVVQPFADSHSNIAWQRIERRYAPYSNACPSEGSSLWSAWQETSYTSGSSLAQSGLETGCWQYRLRAENGAGLVATSDSASTLVFSFASLSQDADQADPATLRPIRFRLQGESRLDAASVGPEDFAISGARLQRIRPTGLPAADELLGSWSLEGDARSARDLSGRGNDLLNASPEVVQRAKPEVLYAWGGNSSSELGDGTSAQRNTPVQITENRDWSALAAGGWDRYGSTGGHSLGIVDGRLWGWGWNEHGQVGNGSTSTRTTPVQIGALADWEQVSAAESQSHAIRAGRLYGWGYGGHHVVGDGTLTTRTSPVQIGNGTNWQAVATGEVHALGIRDGQLWGWGHNDAAGAEGRGVWVGHSTSPGGFYTPEPTQVGSFSDWTDVSAGYLSSYAIREGRLYSWGQNNFGQLGDGTTRNRRYPEPVGSESDWQEVDAGRNHVLGIRNGRLLAWGSNNRGQLGDGTTANRSAPTQIGTWTDWQDVQAGEEYSLGLRQGKLYVWGANDQGQLGIGNTNGQTVPVRVGSADDWRLISAGGRHSLATQEIRSREGNTAWSFQGGESSADANQVAVQSASIPSSVTDASVAGWIRPGVQPHSLWTEIWSLGGSSDNRILSVRQRNTDNALMVQSRTSGSAAPTSCYGPQLPRYTWTHVIAVRDSAAGKLSLFVNGQSVASCSIATGSSTVSTGQNVFRVGAADEGDDAFPYSFRGQMSDLALWNTALSAAEAEQAFQYPSAYEILVDPVGTGAVSVGAAADFAVRDTSGAQIALQPGEDRSVEFTGSLPRLEMGGRAVFTDMWSSLSGAAPEISGYTGDVRVHLRTQGAEMRLRDTSGLSQALGYTGWTSGTEELVFKGSQSDANAALAGLQVRAGVSAEPRFLAKLGTGSAGTGSGELNYPVDAAVDSRGNVYVADTYNHRIQKFNSSGELVATLGGPVAGSSSTTFNLPHGVDIDANDNVYVADTDNNRIQKYTSALTYLASYGSVGTANGQLRRPQDVVVDSSGDIYIADTNNHRVQRWSSAGVWRATQGGASSGTPDGLFSSPRSLDVDSRGNVYVADSGNHRIQKLSAAGSGLEHTATWGGTSPGAGPGQFDVPSGLAVAPDGSIWVADRNNHRLQELDSDGRFIMQTASRGSDDGELLYTGGISLDQSGNLWVADQHNHRLQKFALDGRQNLPGTDPEIDAWVTRATAVYNPDTDTYYRLSSGRTWMSTEGYSTPWNGMEPYTVTVGSRSELEFIERSVTDGTFWMGGGDGVREGKWIWTGGPEAGSAFWNGQSAGSPVNQGSAPGLLASGGNAETVWIDGTWYGVHSFTLGSSTPTYFRPDQDILADYLLVGGGGGGGGVIGGGGGAGGVLAGKMRLRAGQEYPIQIGRGGPGGVGYNNSTQRGEPGQDTRALGLRAFGGGGGSAYGDADPRGATAGGSGGGGARAGSGGTGTRGQGSAGGTSTDGVNAGAGGGGAGAVGGINSTGEWCFYGCTTYQIAGAGGSGISSSISGSVQSYGGGGGGGSRGGLFASSGGAGGGGFGSISSVLAGAGTAGTGGGGGGAGYNANSSDVLGGSGGSGTVVIRYPLPTGAAYAPWAAGEPNNWNTGEDCAQVYTYSQSERRFNDASCGSSFATIFEYGGRSDEVALEESSGTTTLLYQAPPSSSEGELWTWGAAANGATGNGQTSPDVLLPQRIGTESNWDQVESAHSNSFAIRDGQLWGWGLNTSYQLGLGDTTQRTVPTRIGTASDWEMISVGSSSVAGIRNGQLWTWGSNADCRTAQASCSGFTTTPTRVGSASDWTWVSVGRTGMAAIRQGQLWTVGSNLDYGTAQGTNSGITTALTRVGSASDWTQVALGGQAGSPGNVTGAGIRGGQLWTWGSNLYGQTAQGTTSGTTQVPTQVGAGTAWEDGWTDINMSALSIGAGIRDGQLWTWGSNSSYGTGQGTDTGILSTPQRVGTAADWQDAAVGWSAGLALRQNGTLWSWGSNAVGTPGQGSSEGSTRTPTQVGSASSWTALPQGSPRAVAAIRGPEGSGPERPSEAQGAINVSWDLAPDSPSSSSADLLYRLSFAWRSTGEPANIAASLEPGDFLNEGSATGCSLGLDALSSASVSLSFSGCSEGTVLPVLGTRGTGGEISSLRANGKTYQVHTFRTSEQLRLPRSLPVEYLLVGGGGGGGNASSGNWEAGGGGAGGVLEGRRQVQAGEYSVAVGEGGAPGASGSTSSWNGIAALGGGAGGSSASGNGSSGGSGGGSGWGGSSGGSGSPGQGFAGERGGDGAGRNDVCCSGGGGGGAGEPGGTDFYGAGGDGIISMITGTPTWYGGGGGAKYYNGTDRGRGAGGAGGGGDSGIATGGASAGERGRDGTGGGGGGAFRHTSSGGAGGSGIVVLRYPVRDYRDSRGPEVLLDRSEPSVLSWERVAPAESPADVYEIEYEINFSEPIQGLQASDFDLGDDLGEGSGAWSVSALSGSGSGPYRFVVSGTARGVRIQPSLPPGAFQDLAGLPSLRQFTGPATEISVGRGGNNLQSEASFWLRADALGLEEGDRVASWQSSSSDLRFAEAHPDRWPRWSEELLPRLWIDASNREFVGTVGEAVASVRDNSSFGNDVSQGLASARPALSYWGDKSVISFDGNDYLDDASGSYPSNLTVVAVAKSNSSSGYQRILNGGTSTDARMFFGGANGSFAAFSGDGRWNDTAANTPNRTFTEPSVLSSVVDGKTVSSFVNGTAQNTKTGAYTASGFTGARIGAINDSDGALSAIQPSSQFFRGELGEILVFPSALPAAERQMIEAYLARKWGLSLENNNPYTTNGYEWCAPAGGTCAWESGEPRMIVYGEADGWTEKTVRSPASCSGAADTNLTSPCFFVTGSSDPAPRFASAWGALGSTTGDLRSPTGIDIDPDGSIWVADTENHRVQKFTSSGQFLMQMGTGTSGPASNQLASPRDVVVDAAGNVYVVDTGNSRIQKFNSSGTFLASYGSQGSSSNQLSTPSSIALDSDGSMYIADSGNNRILKWSSSGGVLQDWGSAGVSQLQTPYGIAINPDGSLWVADSGNRRIQKFAPDGRSIMKIGSQGLGDSSFGNPRDVAVAKNGDVYVTDSDNNQVQKFNADGAFLSKFASADGQLNSPVGIAMGSNGSIYIADSGNNRISAFSATRQPLYVSDAIGNKPAVRFDGGDGLVAGGSFGEPFTAIAVARSDAESSQSILSGGSGCSLLMGVSSDGFYESNVGGPAGACWSSPSGSNTPKQSLSSAAIVAMSSDGRTLQPYWNGQPQDSRSGGMAEFRGMTVGSSSSGSGFSGDIAEIIYFENVLSTRERQYLEGYLAHKYGLAGSLSDDHPYKATKPDPSGQTEIPWTPDMLRNENGSSALAGWWRPEELGDQRVWNGRFATTQTSQDGDFSGDGNRFYVSDYGNDRVQVFDRQGKFLFDWGESGGGPGEFNGPLDVAVSTSGRVQVLDSSGRIQVFSSSGDYLFETESDDAGSITVDSSGRIYSTAGNQVYLYNAQGDLSGSFRVAGAASAITVDEDDNLWVADSESCRLSQYSSDGRLLQTLENSCQGESLRDVAVGARGIYLLYEGRVEIWDLAGRLRGSFTGSGANKMQNSRGIALAPGGDVWVADSGRSRLLRFGSDGDLLQSIGGRSDLRFQDDLASWPDASGRGRDLGTSSLAAPSISRKAIAGYNVATFDGAANSGSGQNLETPFAVGWPYSLYYVGRMTGEKNGRLLASANMGSNWLLGYWNGQEDELYAETWIKQDGPAATTNWNTYGVIGGQRASSSRWMQLRKNGRALAYASGAYTDANAPRGLSLGASGAAATYRESSSGQVAEVVLVGASLSENNRQRLEGYLAWKYDQQNTLPEDHPYHNQPPTVTVGLDLGENNGGPRIEQLNSTPYVTVTRDSKLDFRLRLSSKLNKDPQKSDFRVNNLPPDWEVSAVDPGSSNYRDIVQSTDPREYWTLEGGNGFTNQAGSASLLPQSGALAGSAPYRYKSVFGSSGDGDGQLSSPSDTAIDSSGSIYVVDSANDRVQKFDSRGRYILQWGTSGSGNGEFQQPAGIAIDVADNVYVAEAGSHRIQKFSSEGDFLTSWGSEGSGNGQFSAPRGIATDRAGNIYVADSGNHRLQKFSSEGDFLASWGQLGTSNRSFNTPVDVDIDRSGNIYVLDQGNSRIQKLTSAGVYSSKWGSPGTGNGQLSSPSSIALDSLGNVYVADSGNSRIQKFTSGGVPLARWGGPGSGREELSEPRGIALGRSGDLIVTDSGNSRIQIWGVASPLQGGLGGSTGLNQGTSGQYLGTSYIPPAPVRPSLNATGAVTTSSLRIDGQAHVLHRFTGAGSLQARRDTRADYLLVGGGGGGGGVIGGGGGGGGLLAGKWSLEGGSTYPVEVGSGGTGGLGWANPGMRGNPGGDTTLFGLSAIGGGGGGGWSCCGDKRPATAGGSGGGGSGALREGGPARRGQGFVGGRGAPGASQWQEDLGGGGGGAGARGGNATPSLAGNGGQGRRSSITGLPVWYGGGGGGGARAGFGTAGSGGEGGGAGGVNSDIRAADGADGLGGGGGGGAVLATSAQTGGSGGSGVAIVRYPSEGTSSSYIGWARTGSSAAQTLLGTSAPDGSNWRLRREADGTSVSFKAGSATYNWPSAWPHSGGWVQWALVLDASLAKVFFYSNGILRGEQNLDPASWPVNPGTLQIGTRASGAESWQGDLAHFAVYERAFSGDEIIGSYEEAFDLRRGLASREYIVSVRRNSLEPAERWIRLNVLAGRWRGKNGIAGPPPRVITQGGVQAASDDLAGQSNLVLYDTLAPRASWQLASPSNLVTRASTIIYNLQLEDLGEISDISVDDIALDISSYEGAPLAGESVLQCSNKQLLLDGQVAPSTLPSGGGTLQLQITGCSGDGVLRPVLQAGSIRDQAGNWGPSSNVSGAAVSIDQTSPSADWQGPEEE